MVDSLETTDKILLLQIQNRQKPYEVIDLVWDRNNNTFQTDGLKNLFEVKEIRIESRNFFQSIERYAHVLSFLLQTMSDAKEYKLPYAFQNQFEFGKERYTLYEEGDYRVLKELGQEENNSLPVQL
jgi:hypothetical protein